MLRRINARKERRKKFWMGAVLVFLMVFSMMGVIIGNRTAEKQEYNDYKFTQTDDGIFVTKIDGNNMGFNFLPQQLLNINITGNFQNKISSPMMYLTFDPDANVDDLRYIDVIRNDLQTTFDSMVINTQTKESEVYLLPVITCDNATEFVPVIYFHVSNQTSIVVENDCIIVNAQTYEFFKLRDLIVYYHYGVMND